MRRNSVFGVQQEVQTVTDLDNARRRSNWWRQKIRRLLLFAKRVKIIQNEQWRRSHRRACGTTGPHLKLFSRAVSAFGTGFLCIAYLTNQIRSRKWVFFVADWEISKEKSSKKLYCVDLYSLNVLTKFFHFISEPAFSKKIRNI